jgi:hypothetical protein
LLVHTLGYLAVTGLIVFVVYQKLGLEVLRKNWVNLDLIRAVALIVTAIFTLLIPTYSSRYVRFTPMVMSCARRQNPTMDCRTRRA